MNGHIPVLLALGLLVSAAGCSLREPDEIILIPRVDNEFRIELWERLEPFGRRLEFRLSTIKPVPCETATIDADKSRIGVDRIDLDLREVKYASDCMTGTSDALTSVDIGPLSDRTYQLTINLQDIIENSGVLEVSAERYRINLNSPSGIVAPRAELRRVPHHAVWGYVNYGDGGANVAEAWLDRMASLGAQPASLAEGYYGYFERKGNNLSVFGMQERNSRPFVYVLDEDSEALAQAVAEFRAANGSQAEVKVWTSLGEEL